MLEAECAVVDVVLVVDAFEELLDVVVLTGAVSPFAAVGCSNMVRVACSDADEDVLVDVEVDFEDVVEASLDTVALVGARGVVAETASSGP